MAADYNTGLLRLQKAGFVMKFVNTDLATFA